MKKITKDLEKLYLDSCDIYEYEKYIDDNTKALKQRLILKYSNVRCKMSNYICSSNLVFYKEDKFKNSIQKKIKIFLGKEFSIKAGSVIDITRDGEKVRYKNCSSPSIYTNHQEIIAEVFYDVG